MILYMGHQINGGQLYCRLPHSNKKSGKRMSPNNISLKIIKTAFLNGLFLAAFPIYKKHFLRKISTENVLFHFHWTTGRVVDVYWPIQSLS